VSFVEEENGYIFLKGLEFDSFHYSKLVRLFRRSPGQHVACR
jgi:hypothetical protein